jgi:zinc D-Ala-D-Ala carboxypeptidase
MPHLLVTRRQQQQALRTLGWPLVIDGIYGPRSRAAATAFQGGFAYYNIAIDGIIGPETRRALRYSLNRDGRASAHTRFREFKCRHCGDIRLDRRFVRAFDVYRARFTTRVTSGYRCPTHNRNVGGATRSQHLYGRAADIPGAATLARVRGLETFTGIGVQRRTGLVVHVDRRDGNVRSPTVWYYS